MTEAPLGPGDRLAIHELIALYGHIVDDRAWDRIGELFVADVTYDAAKFGKGVWRGIQAVHVGWAESKTHPVAHLAANVVIEDGTSQHARARFKGLGVGRKGRVGAVDYATDLVKTSAGWRIATLTATPRSAPASS